MKRKRTIALITLASLVIFASMVRAQPAEQPPQPTRVTVAQTGGQTVVTQGRGAHAAVQAFNVVLVLGTTQGSAQDDVPPAVRKALADVKDFLPYKGYKLLDTQWSLCCGNQSGMNTVMMRLRGPEDQDYELRLDAAPMGSVVTVRFNLTESGGSTPANDAEAAQRALLSDLQAQLSREQQRFSDLKRKGLAAGQPQTIEQEQKIRELQRELVTAQSRGRGGRGAAVIDASFKMDIGETVVVGTSKVKGGDKALIALLTAVPQKSSER